MFFFNSTRRNNLYFRRLFHTYHQYYIRLFLPSICINFKTLTRCFMHPCLDCLKRRILYADIYRYMYLLLYRMIYENFYDVCIVALLTSSSHSLFSLSLSLSLSLSFLHNHIYLLNNTLSIFASELIFKTHSFFYKSLGSQAFNLAFL